MLDPQKEKPLAQDTAPTDLTRDGHSPSTTPSASMNDAQLSALERIEKRLARMEASLALVEAQAQKTQMLAEQAPLMAASAIDSVDDFIARAQARGIDVDERARSMLHLIERLTEPETMALAEVLLDHRDQLGRLVELSNETPGLVATVVDSLDHAMGKMMERGIEPAELTRNASDALLRFVRLMQSPEFEALMNSGILDPHAVQVVAAAAQALKESYAEPTSRAGVFRLMGAVREASVQRAMDFGLRFARRFGELLRPQLGNDRK